MCARTWEDPEIQQIGTVNQANQNDWSKETQKKCLIKVIQTATRAQFSDSLSFWVCTCAYPHVLSFFLINTLFYYFLPLWEFFSDLVARTWCSHHHDPAQSPAGIPSPAPSCCRLRPPKIKVTRPGDLPLTSCSCRTDNSAHRHHVWGTAVCRAHSLLSSVKN